MKPQTTPTLSASLSGSDPVAWIGLDWGHFTHAVALKTPQGPLEEFTLEHSAEALHKWLKSLAERFGGHTVAVGLENSRGAVIAALLEYPWVSIYPINPATSARYRQAFTPSGASDDQPDARILLELVCDHTAKLRPLELQDPLTRQLTELAQVRRHLVDRRTQVINEMTSLLRAYYPQALTLVGNLNTDLALAFLNRWPDLLSLKLAKPSTVRRFYYAHQLRRPELLQERLNLIATAVALNTDETRTSVAVLQLRCQLDQLRVLRQHVELLDHQLKQVLDEHPEAYLFKGLPGAGPVSAARLCAAFGTLRYVYPDPASLQKKAGLAPVREKSGKQLWVHWRWHASAFLRQTFVEWAGQTIMHSAWARQYYLRMKAKGKSHWAILRALAFKWVRVLWKCWLSHTPYDENRYLKQLQHRKSPNAVSP